MSPLVFLWHEYFCTRINTFFYQYYFIAYLVWVFLIFLSILSIYPSIYLYIFKKIKNLPRLWKIGCSNFQNEIKTCTTKYFGKFRLNIAGGWGGLRGVNLSIVYCTYGALVVQSHFYALIPYISLILVFSNIYGHLHTFNCYLCINPIFLFLAVTWLLLANQNPVWPAQIFIFSSHVTTASQSEPSIDCINLYLYF